MNAKTFSEEMGLFYESQGLTRMTGRIIGWLLISDPPEQTMDEIVKGLKVSKSSVSSATSLLTKLDMIERKSIPGKRKDVYLIKYNQAESILTRNIQVTKEYKNLVENGLKSLDRKQFRLTRLEELDELLEFIEIGLIDLLNKWHSKKNMVNIVENSG